MEEQFTCDMCGKKFIGRYNGANFARFCGKECGAKYQAGVDAWMYSGQWLNDLAKITSQIAHLTESLRQS